LDGAGPEDPESAAALLGRFWKLIEPAVLMQAIQDGRVQAWRARLVPAARSLVGFPERQFEALREARPEESTDLLRRTHAARKAWFSRLLSFEPALIDFCISLEEHDARAAAALFSHLADFVVHKAMHGPRNAVNSNRSNRALRGLSIAPLLVESWRGLCFEWMLLQLVPSVGNVEGAAADEPSAAAALRRNLAVVRQFLRALRLAEPAETSQRPANEAQGAELQRPQTPSDFRDLIKCAASARKKDGTSPMLVLTEGDNDNGHSDVCL